MDYGMDRAALLDRILVEGVELPGYAIKPVAGSPFLLPVFRDSGRREASLAVCAAWTCSSGATSYHNIVLAYDPIDDNFAFWCGDSILEGVAKDSSERANRAADFMRKKGYAPSTKLKYPKLTVSTGCNFFKTPERICKHCRGLFFGMTNGEHDNPSDELDALVSAASALLPRDGKAKRPAAAKKAGDPIMNRMQRYAFARNVLIEGDKGWGKTHLVGRFCAEHKVDETVFIGGHEGLESTDLLGHMIRTADGALAWKDGKLSEAFRYAQMGLRTVLCIDEILRIRRRELSVLVAALSPGHDGKLRLGTGRPLAVVDGIAREEVLVCAREHLWVVSTTNVGAGYDVEDMEEALSDRFPIVLRIEGSEDELRTKLGGVIAARGFKPELIEHFVKIWKTFEKFRTQGELTRQMNLRHLCEVVEMATHEADIHELLVDRIPLWVERDSEGKLVQAQVTAVQKALGIVTFSTKAGADAEDEEIPF